MPREHVTGLIDQTSFLISVNTLDPISRSANIVCSNMKAAAANVKSGSTY
jgi:hypothetical protein